MRPRQPADPHGGGPLINTPLQRGANQIPREPVQLELMGRKENFDVIKVPESVPNLLGQVPLEVLDFVVDPWGQKLIPNAAHGGEQTTEENVSVALPLSKR